MLSRVHWVHPELVVEVKYPNWTEENLPRQMVYQGRREDKDPRRYDVGSRVEKEAYERPGGVVRKGPTQAK